MITDTTTMSDRELAVAYNEALSAYHADDQQWEDLVDCENEICGRLNLPLDQTEQGLTEWACQQLACFVLQHAGEVRA